MASYEESVFGLVYLKPFKYERDIHFEKSDIVIGGGTEIGLGTKISRGVVIGKNVTIGQNCFIGNNTLIRENVIIGDRTKIGFSNAIEPYAIIGNDTRTQGFCMISEYSNIGNNVFLGPYFNNPADNTIGKPNGEYQPDPTVIRDESRIGSHVVVTPGNIIEKNTIIGAGSVVTKSTEPNSLYYGCPAERKDKVKNK